MTRIDITANEAALGGPGRPDIDDRPAELLDDETDRVELRHRYRG